MARLSVNLNKIALLRNSRRTGVPDIRDFARLAHGAGADGLTVHPRPDERHIRGADIPALAEIMRPWRPACELNIEGYPDERLFEIVRAVRPEQVTLVPDGPGVLTSEEGWKLDNRDTPLVNPAVAGLRWVGCRAPAPTASRSIPGTMPPRVAPATPPPHCRPVRRRPRAPPRSGSSSMPGTTSTSTICPPWSRPCRLWPKPRSATS